jgi:hypothetical protein
MELESVVLEEFTQPQPEPAAEATAECLDGQEEAARGIDPARAIRSEAAGGNDVVDMGMMLEALSPGMEHAEESDVGSQVPGIASQIEHRRGADAIEQIVEQPLVLQHESGEFMGSVNTTWKYGTGNSSAERAASHLARALPWHLGQCRLRHELKEMAWWPQRTH